MRQIGGFPCLAAHHLVTGAIIDDEPLKVRQAASASQAPEKPKAPLKAANDELGIRLLSFAEFKAQENSTADALIKGLVRTGTLIAIGGRPGEHL